MEKYIQDRKNMAEKPVRSSILLESAILILCCSSQMLIAEFLVRAAPPAELVDTTLLAMRMVDLNFGSIHTRHDLTLHDSRVSSFTTCSQLDLPRPHII
jgi:hypothetical protein